MPILDKLGLGKVVNLSDVQQFQFLTSAVGVLIAAFIVIALMWAIHHHMKIKPRTKAVGTNVQVLIAGLLDSIYDAYERKGVKLERVYPKNEDIRIRNGKIMGINSWLIRPNKPNDIKSGNVGTIHLERLFVWRKEDRTRICALLAAWWFNIYYYTLEGKPLGPLNYSMNVSKLPKLRRICNDTLKFAGIHEVADPSSRGTTDVVKLLTGSEKVEQEHRNIAKIEDKDIKEIEKLADKETESLGRPENIHKLAKAMQTHMFHLVMLGKEQLKILKSDAAARKQLGEEKADSDFKALTEDIARLEVQLSWLEERREHPRADREANKELSARLKLFEQTVLDISDRLHHIDNMISGVSA